MYKREDIYKTIDGERRYQISRWSKEFDDSQWSIGDWIIFIERYIEEAKRYVGYKEQSLAAIRKIAALSVACMEYNGLSKRPGFEDDELIK
jgi:hypothetical protein